MGSFVGLHFEAPEPEPAQKPQGQGESKPNAGAEKTPASEKVNEDVDALRREMDELRTTNRQLIDLVGRQTPARQQEAPAPAEVAIDWGKDEDEAATPDEPEDPALLVEDLAKLGPAALEKRGYIRKGDVLKLIRTESRKAAATAATQVVSQARTEVTRESAVMQQFPDLADPESDLYKATVAYVHKAVQIDPASAKSPATLYLAAERAQADLDAKRGNRGGDRGRTERDQIDDDFDVEEDDREPVMRDKPRQGERERRIASQQGDRGRQGRSRIQSEEDDFVMTPEAKSIASMMGISTADYTKEATRIRKAAGVSSGRRR